MEGLDPNFSNRIQKGDVIVAGRNFGCGSSREHAVLALQGAGIKYVIAASYARIFYRNAINQGYPILVCPEAAAFAEEGQRIAVDIGAGTVELEGKSFQIEPFPPFLQDIVNAGGIVPFVKNRLAAEARASKP
jgi:3-isopropylmalate dehydratase small subunit